MHESSVELGNKKLTIVLINQLATFNILKIAIFSPYIFYINRIFIKLGLGMLVGNKIKCTFTRYVKNTVGSMALAWALTGVGVILTVGAAYDINQVSKARTIAQLAADNMALAASIAIDTENDDRYEEGKSYPYTELGGPANDFTNSISGTVNYNVDDDGDGVGNLLARSTITGTYNPAFMSAFGVKSIPFEATSDVSYAQRVGKPASIFFVTDNSGSMKSFDNNGVRKISSLKSSMISFMTTLSSLGHGDTIFRTALYPYSSNLIYSKKVDPKWNVLTNNSINLMTASGGTKSTSALKRAKYKFALENSIHDDVNGDDDPLKFLVFMSDGANNGATTKKECSIESVWHKASSEYWIDTYHNWNTRYNSYRKWFDKWVIHYPAKPAGYQDEKVCVDIPYSKVNEASLVHCKSMKANNVVIYSIAYDVRASERALAEDFMKKCSSNTDSDGNYVDNGFYKYASTGADLEQAFNKIGQSVVKEVIRVKR